jgi:hypothetical protein
VAEISAFFGSNLPVFLYEHRMVGTDMMLVNAERGEISTAEHAEKLAAFRPLLLRWHCGKKRGR